MGLPADDLDDLEEPEQEPPAREDAGLDVELELDLFERAEDPSLDVPLEIPQEPLEAVLEGAELADEAPSQLPDEAIELLELPDGTDDAPSTLADAVDDLLGDERSIDDGGEEGIADADDDLDELQALEPDGDGEGSFDMGTAEALPAWGELIAARAPSFDVRFEPKLQPSGTRELAVGVDVDGTRLCVLDDEDGARVMRGDVLVSDQVPELPLAGVAMLGGRPIYWVEGDGLFDNQTYIPQTQGLVAWVPSALGLVLALSVRGEHALALLREGGRPERIADLRSAPEQLLLRGQSLAVSGQGGLEVFTLPTS